MCEDKKQTTLKSTGEKTKGKKKIIIGSIIAGVIGGLVFSKAAHFFFFDNETPEWINILIITAGLVSGKGLFDLIRSRRQKGKR